MKITVVDKTPKISKPMKDFEVGDVVVYENNSESAYLIIKHSENTSQKVAVSLGQPKLIPSRVESFVGEYVKVDAELVITRTR